MRRSTASHATARGEEGIRRVMALIGTHDDSGGTEVNMYILDRQTILAAQEDPAKHPALVVRVTGFSACFNRLSDDFRKAGRRSDHCGILTGRRQP